MFRLGSDEKVLLRNARVLHIETLNLLQLFWETAALGSVQADYIVSGRWEINGYPALFGC
jgi:hypothetical protein